MGNSVLIIASHPDDEILGCGGTMKKLIKNGYEVVTVITAKGRKEEEQHMQTNIIKANTAIGVKEVIFLQYPNLEMETFPLHKIAKDIEALIKNYKPKMIFTHHYGDLNRDQQISKAIENGR